MMFRTLPLGVYVNHDSPIHRLNPGLKFAVLISFILITAIFANTIFATTIALAVVVLAYLLARIPPRVAAGQVLPVMPVLLLLGAFQWWQRGVDVAGSLFLGLTATVSAAALLTLTTTIAELMDSLERWLQPLARFGLPVDHISLAISLTLRLIPLQLDTINEVLAARKARGACFSLAAFGTPVVIRTIRRARALGEALIARGVDD